MNIEPLGDRVVVQREEAEKEYHGILLPENSAEIPAYATVVAVGPGKRMADGTHEQTMTVKVGDRVLVGKYVGSTALVGDTKYVIVHEDEILGVVS